MFHFSTLFSTIWLWRALQIYWILVSPFVPKQSGKRSIRVSRMLRGQMRPFCPDGRCFKNWQQWISKTFFTNRIFSILAWKSFYFCWLGYCGRPQLFISLLYLILRIFLSLSHFNFSLCLAKKTRFRKKLVLFQEANKSFKNSKHIDHQRLLSKLFENFSKYLIKWWILIIKVILTNFDFGNFCTFDEFW